MKPLQFVLSSLPLLLLFALAWVVVLVMAFPSKR